MIFVLILYARNRKSTICRTVVYAFANTLVLSTCLRNTVNTNQCVISLCCLIFICTLSLNILKSKTKVDIFCKTRFFTWNFFAFLIVLFVTLVFLFHNKTTVTSNFCKYNWDFFNFHYIFATQMAVRNLLDYCSLSALFRKLILLKSTNGDNVK